jgi:hypothetical protein
VLASSSPGALSQAAQGGPDPSGRAAPGYVQRDYSVGVLLKDMGKVLNVSYAHNIDPTSSVGAEVTKKLEEKEATVFALGRAPAAAGGSSRSRVRCRGGGRPAQPSPIPLRGTGRRRRRAAALRPGLSWVTWALSSGALVPLRPALILPRPAARAGTPSASTAARWPRRGWTTRASRRCCTRLSSSR